MSFRKWLAPSGESTSLTSLFDKPVKKFNFTDSAIVVLVHVIEVALEAILIKWCARVVGIMHAQLELSNFVTLQLAIGIDIDLSKELLHLDPQIVLCDRHW